MRRIRTVFLFVFSLWCSAVFSYAQESPETQERQAPSLQELPSQSVSQLRPVVVTATRTETPLQETAVSVTVIKEEEIQRQQAITVTEALRTVPGLDFAPTGSRGTTTSIFIRGAESDQTLVLIDGVEVNSVTLGSFDFSNLTTENIDRIEVLRGSGGTLYGSQAVGGVINVLTKKGEGAPQDITLLHKGPAVGSENNARHAGDSCGKRAYAARFRRVHMHNVGLYFSI